MKKFMKMLGVLSLALVLACTSLVFADTARTASAAAKAKSLKLKKKKVTVSVGEKVKLKVTVKPKKAKIKWSTNKKKIATVSKKGEVTGKKKGTAKITAKSGKKKAVCTVKVTAAKAGIKSVAVTNPKIIRVTLTQAASLKATDFAVKKKGNAKGAYNTALKVANITKVSSKIYDLNLYTDPAYGESDYVPDVNRIYGGEYTQVTVKKLKGNKTGETVYYSSNYAYNTYERALVGQKFEHSYGFSQSYMGYASGIKVSGVPSGLTAKVYGDTVVVSGTPNVAKASVMTFTGKDELGKSLKQNVYFYIGSDSVMLSYTETENRTILANDNNSESFRIYTIGGSGDYTYSLTNNTNKLINISEYGGYITFGSYTRNANNSKTYLSPGTYNLAYNVKDDKGHSNNGTLSVTAVNGVMVSGKVTAGDNSGIEDASVYASFRDEKHTYYSSSFSTSTYSKDEEDRYSTSATPAKKAAGDYNIIIYPSQIYDLRAYKNGLTVYANSRRIGTAAASVNFQLPLYKVTITAGTDNLSNVRWYDSVTDTSYGYGNVLYLKKGSYKLESTNSEFFKYTANFTVNGNMTVNASRTTTVVSKGTLPLNTPTSLSNLETYENNYYTFVPSAAGNYTLTLEGVNDSDTGVRLRDANGNYVASTSLSRESVYDEDDDFVSYTFTLNMPNLVASQTYYIEIYSYQYSSMTATISNAD